VDATFVGLFVVSRVGLLAAAGGLLDEPSEDIVNDVFEISEKPVNSVSGWRFVEAAVVPTRLCWSSRVTGRVP
jgi:hypothetical protein